MKPLTLIIDHTLATLDGLPTARQVELLHALRDLSVSKEERASLDTQITALRTASKANEALRLNIRARADN